MSIGAKRAFQPAREAICRAPTCRNHFIRWPPPIPVQLSSAQTDAEEHNRAEMMYVVGINVQLKNRTAQDDALWLPSPTSSQFKAALEMVREWLPLECVSCDPQELLFHGTSPWSYHHPDSLPGAVLYPRSTQDVAQIVKIASKYHIPIVPFSGGTSLEGHFNAPSSAPVDPHNHHLHHHPAHEQDPRPSHGGLGLVVQPGVSYEDLNRHLRDLSSSSSSSASSPHTLFFPVDPGPGAQIGGMIGTGCSGTNAVRHDARKRDQYDGRDGQRDVVKTRQRAKKCAAGPDLGKLFIGSEGTLGLVTEATLRLQPVLPTSVGVAHFASVHAATSTVLELIKQGVSLACIELLDDQMMMAVNHASDTFKYEEKPSLFLKFTGTQAQIKSDEELTAKILKRNGGSQMKMAKSEAEAAEIWHARKVCLWSTLDYAPGHRAWTTDVCVPLSHLPRLIADTKADIHARNLKATMLGHVGDGNFHCILLFNDHHELAQVRQCVHQMVRLAQDLDGTCTGEHGVGIGKMMHLEYELGKGTLDLLRKIKRTVDPQNIMNPGKLIPPT
ncbi:hypothetical protein PCASD_10543 [Puccinia coronata f. sp. avenae]|uniref:D-lactate dehydrogenase (cytochrome) n=1 Tax=Puccinia coronata f. sp. avenae TaxID=200324 RepID=A0A2N5TC86_9BASI|nr:hypothetical protein PCASD_10543 [Puccinia coronata f. sp. avenae]